MDGGFLAQQHVAVALVGICMVSSGCHIDVACKDGGGAVIHHVLVQQVTCRTAHMVNLAGVLVKHLTAGQPIGGVKPGFRPFSGGIDFCHGFFARPGVGRVLGEVADTAAEVLDIGDAHVAGKAAAAQGNTQLCPLCHMDVAGGKQGGFRSVSCVAFLDFRFHTGSDHDVGGGRVEAVRGVFQNNGFFRIFLDVEGIACAELLQVQTQQGIRADGGHQHLRLPQVIVLCGNGHSTFSGPENASFAAGGGVKKLCQRGGVPMRASESPIFIQSVRQGGLVKPLPAFVECLLKLCLCFCQGECFFHAHVLRKIHSVAVLGG